MMKESAISLDPHSIITAASEQTGGLTDTGEQFFTEGLNKACESLEQESELNATGRYMARDRLIGHTVNRLRYLEDRKLNPAIAKEKIEKPVFIIGLPRTGTTILHDILAQDLSSRVPLTWECMFPSPPPERKTYLTDPRIEKCQATFPDTFELMPEFKMMHPMGADLSQECIVMWGESMCTPLFHGQWFMPSYQDWVDQANFAPVYDFHKKQLQHLQWRCPNDRWVLKSGGHMWGLEHLLATYPDARIIFTHRDPVKSMTSFASLCSTVYSIGSDEVDALKITDDWTARNARALHHALDVRGKSISPDAKIYDMFFSDFVSDQFAEIERIYAALDIEMSGEAADRMRAYIDSHPKGVHGNHTYKADDFGIAPSEVRQKFNRYIEHFDIRYED